MGTIILTVLIFICGIFIGLSAGVRAVTEHLIENNRLTESEAAYYYSLRNLIDIFKNKF